MSVQRIAIIGDIHAEDDLLDSVLRFLAKTRVDANLAVGDIVDGSGDADKCCALLAAYGVITVRGNHDLWFLRKEPRSLPGATRWVRDDTRAFLASLPMTRELATPIGRASSLPTRAERCPPSRGFS